VSRFLSSKRVNRHAVIRYVGQHHLALLALFVALGGTSYAAVSLPANSVGTRQIHIHAVTLSKISTSARTALTGHQGTRGPQGPVGPTGPRGVPGSIDTSNFYTKSASDSRYLQLGQAGSGQGAVGFSGYGDGPMTVLRQVTVAVGPTARHAFIEADADIWSAAGATCDGFLELSWGGNAQSTTNASATAPVNGAVNGKASLTTSALPLLPPGSQVVQLLGATGASGCIGLQDSRLNVVLLNQ
jgi:hypothetical protein